MKKTIICLLYICCFFCVKAQEFLEVKKLTGKWQNSSRIVNFETEQTWLKTFYTLWNDGPYSLYELEQIRLLQVEDKVFLNFYEKKDDIFIAVNNKKNVAISPVKTENKFFGYVFSETEKDLVYKVLYWKSEVLFSDEKIEFENSIIIPKHIAINDIIYTCVTGRGNKLRNVKAETIEDVFGTEILHKNEKYLAIGEPFLTKIKE
ncbi:MAG: hypothetical protein GX220_03790 [Treponema sp.]|nr:hypothetical protein [Treponema sp.]